MALNKRIKRHIWSRDHSFLVTQIAQLREICTGEMRAEGLAIIRETDHGIYFSGKIEDVYRAHLRLRSASRIWLCLDNFKAGAREELFRKTASIPWELLLNPGVPLDVSARVRYSRLEHEGETAATITEAIMRRFRESGERASPETGTSAETEPRQRIHGSVEKDRVELRIDLSGPHLHKRGYRLQQGAAPLRETLAAGIVQWGLDIWHEKHPGSPWPRRIHDPFCGSGTILIEAEILRTGIAPGSMREFLFMQQPHFRAAAFEYLRRETHDRGEGHPECGISGSDYSAEIIESARGNSAAAGVKIDFTVSDAFKSFDHEIFGPETLIISNPPYGERLPEGGAALYRRLLGKLKDTGTSGVIIVPRSLEAELSFSGTIQRLNFTNGGIPVSAIYLEQDFSGP
jgi:putative N6-adenine-specific DNA methylase